MCWFSAEHADHIETARAGERLGVRTMTWHANWVVRETELGSSRPCPVCLTDRTRVLFRLSENQQAKLHLGSEAEAVFRMLEHPKRDIFEFADGRQITLSELPTGLIFDVLVVPGSERLSAVLNMELAAQNDDKNDDKEESEKEPFFARLLARF